MMFSVSVKSLCIYILQLLQSHFIHACEVATGMIEGETSLQLLDGCNKMWHRPHWMKPIDFGDPLTFHRAPPAG